LRWLSYITLLAVAAIPLSCSPSEQKEVVLYCSADQAIAEPIIAAFERQTGIKVLARFDTEASKTVGLVQRLRAEAGSPVADVFWSSEIFHTIRLANEGRFQSHADELKETRPKSLADPEGRWHGFAVRARVIAYDTRRVKPEDAPRSLEDLLDPKWAGRLVMAAPEFGTTGGDVASWFAHYGRERATEILRGLKSVRVRIVGGNSTAVRMLATGQADVALTDTDDVYAAQRNDWPIKMNYLDQGGDGVLAIPNTVAIIKGAPHLEEARLLAAFLLGAQAETMLAQSDSHNTPVRPDVAKQFPAYAIPKRLDIDYARIAAELPAAIVTAREILR